MENPKRKPTKKYTGMRHTITFPPDIYEAIAKKAEEEDRPYAQMVIRLLRLQLERKEQNEI